MNQKNRKKSTILPNIESTDMDTNEAASKTMTNFGAISNRLKGLGVLRQQTKLELQSLSLGLNSPASGDEETKGSTRLGSPQEFSLLKLNS